MQDSLDIPQHDDPHRHPLDDPRSPRHLHDVAHRELILEQQEEPADHVLDQTLCPERNGETDHPDAGQQGTDLDEEIEDHEAGRDRDHHAADAVQELGQRLRPGFALGALIGVAAPDDPLEPTREQAQHPEPQPGQDDDPQRLAALRGDVPQLHPQGARDLLDRLPDLAHPARQRSRHRHTPP